MTKTIPEIDDAMIERYMDAIEKCAAERGLIYRRDREVARAGLTAALTEPEIEVTEAMCTAGVNAFDASPPFTSSVAAMYRAMVKAAPNGAKSAPQGVNAGAPEKATGGGVERKEWKFHDREGDSFMTRHRRSTDPK
jgi:hypothetical protein